MEKVMWRGRSIVLLALSVTMLLCGMIFYFFEQSRKLIDEHHNQQAISKFLQRVAGNSGYSEPVRVLFYGQSITRQTWSHEIENYIQQSFPGVTFKFANLAVGGHAADRLKRLVDADVLPFLPDLVIFHVYGGSEDYEEIVRTIRTSSSAAMIVATDHLVSDSEINEETRPSFLFESKMVRNFLSALRVIHENSTFYSWRNNVFIPGMAEKYGLFLIDVRSSWKRAVQDSGHSVSFFLADQVHLNEMGNRLMSHIFRSSLADFFKIATHTYMANSRIKQFNVELPINYSSCVPGNVGDGFLVRITRPIKYGISILINGKKPDADLDTFWFTRVSELAGTGWPGLLHVIEKNDNHSDDWEVYLKNKAPNGAIEFTVRSNLTGDEGFGRTDRDYISRSGRIEIKAKDWNIEYVVSVFKSAGVVGEALRWSGRHLGFSKLSADATKKNDIVIYQRRENKNLNICLYADDPLHSAQFVHLEVERAAVDCLDFLIYSRCVLQ